jgi:hypothetical protein
LTGLAGVLVRGGSKLSICQEFVGRGIFGACGDVHSKATTCLVMHDTSRNTGADQAASLW